LAKHSISVFFPCYNDAATMPSMVLSSILALQQLTDDYEVIVVNDGSPDHVAMLLAELQKSYPCLRVVTHEKNMGYGAAIRSGIGAATKDLIFYTDGDAQYDPREIKVLYAMLDEDIDMVNGYKIKRGDPWYRLVIGKLYHWMVKLMFRLPVRDVDCDFRLMRRRIFDSVELESDSGIICVELMRKISACGFRIAEAPVHHFHRAHGKSQFFNFGRVFAVGRNLLVLWWKLVVRSSNKKP
jgi:glycosyltransferase involved in cell wall biosynthesis